MIGRDLLMVAFSANLAGKVDRDTRAVVGLLEFLRLIGEGLSQEVRSKPMVELAPNEVAAAASGSGRQNLGRPSIMPESLLLNTSSVQAASSDEVVEILLNCIRAMVSTGGGLGALAEAQDVQRSDQRAETASACIGRLWCAVFCQRFPAEPALGGCDCRYRIGSPGAHANVACMGILGRDIF